MKIGVVGGLNMDIHLFGGDDRDEDGAYLAERYLIEPGGKGTNQARAAARLGAGVVLVGRNGPALPSSEDVHAIVESIGPAVVLD